MPGCFIVINGASEHLTAVYIIILVVLEKKRINTQRLQQEFDKLKGVDGK